MRAILEAAAHIFDEQGVAGATTDRIAERAGVSIGSLYQYFPSKEAILATLGRCHLLAGWQAVEPALAALDAAPPLAEALPPLVRAVVAANAERGRLHRALFADGPLDPELMAVLGAVRAEACARVARYLAARPEVTVADPALAAHLVFEALMTLAHGFALDGSAGGTPAAREREIVRLLAGYLSPAPSASR
ncbi:MAG TPA: TetR/AcrR family transcriptional regulator [Myxococcota bacterium]|nr:TetR/AcrR family transcriptional regulator [Myxococcota bacterium]